MASIYETRVAPEWVDFNGHMRDAYYGLVFSFATDAFMDDIGMDSAYRARSKGTLYIVEDHRFYLSEVKVDCPLTVTTRILDADAKRIHVHQIMEKTDSGEVAAVLEGLNLHVAQVDEPQVLAMPDEIMAQVMANRLSPDAITALKPRAGTVQIRRKSK